MTRQAGSSEKATVARNLDAAITASGKTNRQVGEAIGATEHQVWRWRRAVVKPSAKYVAALVDLLFAGDFAALYAAPNGNGSEPTRKAAA